MTSLGKISQDGEDTRFVESWRNMYSALFRKLQKYYNAIDDINPQKKTQFKWVQSLPSGVEHCFKYPNGGIFVLKTETTLRLLEEARRETDLAMQPDFWLHYEELKSVFGKGNIPGIIDQDILKLGKDKMPDNQPLLVVDEENRLVGGLVFMLNNPDVAQLLTNISEANIRRALQ
jgi:hypothetical protein